MNAKPEILVLDAAAAHAAIDELADVLVDCVEGGASVSFMLPFGRADGVAFFQKVIASVARGETVLVAARFDGRIVGTVQLGLDMPPNQPRYAELIPPTPAMSLAGVWFLSGPHPEARALASLEG